MREITATTLREDARRRALEAVERLVALNHSRTNVASITSRIPDDRLQAMFEAYYTRFVSRWSVVTPK
jgi:hypothetical protein